MLDLSLVPVLGALVAFPLALWFFRNWEEKQDFGPGTVQQLLRRLYKLARAAVAASVIGAALSLTWLMIGDPLISGAKSAWQMVLPTLSLTLGAIASILLCYYTFAQSDTVVWRLQPSKADRVVGRFGVVLYALAIPVLGLAPWFTISNLSLASKLFFLGLAGPALTVALELLSLVRVRQLRLRAIREDEERRKQQRLQEATSPHQLVPYQFRVRGASISRRLVGPEEGEIHITLNRSGKAIVGGTDLFAPYHLAFGIDKEGVYFRCLSMVAKPIFQGEPMDPSPEHRHYPVADISLMMKPFVFDFPEVPAIQALLRLFLKYHDEKGWVLIWEIEFVSGKGV